jgi:hypothetical protein
MTLAPLTDDLERARLAIRRSHLGNGRPHLAAGLAEANRVIRGGRALPADVANVNEVVVVFASEPAPRDCDATRDAAHDVKALGALVMSVCVGPNCDAGCARMVASNPRYSFGIDDLDKVELVFHLLLTTDYFLNIRRLTIAIDRSDTVALVWTNPWATADPATGTITWITNFVPRDGVTVTLRAQPLAAGRTLLGDVRVQWTDSFDGFGGARADLPAVWALTPLDGGASRTRDRRVLSSH